ncbi:hypothetical protein [Alkalihalobacterium alkalinitrilicum]|uniref:hypothetical protein n=1 Tax=Alkalihalobacterium alkalinitrilicum TaxID=427920 RepID=UPI001C56D703|nr:hypothetical protein [Alkalihalobacterium alkalinitrilicum]
MNQKKWSKFPFFHHGGTTMRFHTYCGFIKEEQIGVVFFNYPIESVKNDKNAIKSYRFGE